MKLKCTLVLAMQLFSVTVFAADTTPSAPPAPTSPTSQSVAPSVSQSVFVVAPEDLPKQTTGVVIDTPKMPEPEKKKESAPITAAQVWSGPVPLSGGLFFLVASMPVLASLYFAYQLYLFIVARRRRLSIRHSKEN
ncbi:hypothetical protein [Undibacterium aquatile]|uniref:Uncharacterized protein n=1 Tax=Undibacterium aquatile TaxID=1537398 RepID=A0ABR6XAX9_9BURK|nr:hypothetical protein [Undibacterium aquatile]MBC3809892.1 hypothetical protein [Undibacterium aquatile]